MLEIYMEKLRQGDISALEQIYMETKNSVFAIALGIVRDYSLAEDIMQDTFIKVKKYIDQYKTGTNAKWWINTIARNIAINLYNRRKKENLFDFDVIQLKDDKVLEAKDESGIIKSVLEILEENESRIVLMHILGEMKLVEIAKIMDKSQGTVRWQYNNALKKLKKNIRRDNNE